MIRWIVLPMIWIAMVSGQDDNTIELEGRREKKSVARLEGQQLLKRAPMGFQGMRGKKWSGNWLDKQMLPENDRKITPIGLQGSEGENDKLISDLRDVYPIGDYEKRWPIAEAMGFQGTRGKKALLQQRYSAYKRVPMGFQGTRGKKSRQDVPEATEKQAYLRDYPDYRKGITSMGGSVSRGKGESEAEGEGEGEGEGNEKGDEKRGELLREWVTRYQTIADIPGTHQPFDKRPIAVLPFRGLEDRKIRFGDYSDYSIDPLEQLDYDNAAGQWLERSRMRFRGARKKRDAEEFDDSNSADTTNAVHFQPGTSNRGTDLAAYQVEKRSPFRYVAVRGKKNPRWEFRGKFVGVRGKKSMRLRAALAATKPLF